MSVRPVLLVDLDGTITDSLPGIEASLHHALDAVGARWDDSRPIRTIAGPPMLETLHSLGLEDDTAELALAEYLRRYEAVGWSENALFPGMAELLAQLREEDYRMAVATSKNEPMARRIIDHFGLSGYFEFVGGADRASGRTVKAAVVAHSLTALGVEPVTATSGATGDALMVGDRAHDVEGAAHFGIPCAVVKWGYGSPHEWDTARWCAGTVDDLEGIIHDW